MNKVKNTAQDEENKRQKTHVAVYLETVEAIQKEQNRLRSVEKQGKPSAADVVERAWAAYASSTLDADDRACVDTLLFLLHNKEVRYSAAAEIIKTHLNQVRSKIQQQDTGQKKTKAS